MAHFRKAAPARRVRGIALGVIISVLGCIGLNGCDAGAQSAASSPIPTEPLALATWLQDGSYKVWPIHSEPHEADARGVGITWLNASLAESLAAGHTVHPKGAAAVREYILPDGSPRGFGLLLKTSSEAVGADAWYFYETFDLEPGSAPMVATSGAPGCASCHAAGRDFVQSLYPSW